MKKYLEYKDEKSHKFWQIEVEDNSFTVTYGKVDTKGQSKTKEFDSETIALDEARKIINKKYKKGYQTSFQNIANKWSNEIELFSKLTLENSTESFEKINEWYKTSFQFHIEYVLDKDNLEDLNLEKINAILDKIKLTYQDLNQLKKSFKQSKIKTDCYTSKMLNNFKKKFAPHQLPKTLIELIKFDDNKDGNSYYSQSFYLNDDIEEDFFETWLDNDQTDEKKRQEYAKNMLVFANADGTGGSYAMWIQEGNTDLEKAPIVFYGSEGEIMVVANNLKDLIKMLSFGAEGMDGSFYHYLDSEDYEEDPTFFYRDFVENRPNFLKFRKWMKETLNIEPVDIKCLKEGECEESEEVAKLVEKAKKKYNKVFDKWQYQFYSDPKDEEKKYQEKRNAEYEKIKNDLLVKIARKPTVADYIALAKNENLLDKIDFKQRENYYEKALALEPESEKTLELLAKENSYSNTKKAIEYYTKLIAISNNKEKYYSDLAYVYESNKSYTKALNFYVKDILANPNSYGDYSQNYIVDICKELKNKDAIEILEETVQKVANKNTYNTLYKLYFKKKNYTIASENAVKYIENSDEQAHNYMDIAERFFKKEAYQEAIPILEKTIDRHTWDERKMRTYNNLGLCYIRLETKNIDKGFSAFKEAYKLVPEQNAIHQNINLCGSYYIDTKEYDKAIVTFQFCIDNNLAKDMATFNTGVCYIVQQKYKEALPYYEEALKLNPDNEKYKKALEVVQKQLKSDEKGFFGKIFGKKI